MTDGLTGEEEEEDKEGIERQAEAGKEEAGVA
jgi:hypothetical protein